MLAEKIQQQQLATPIAIVGAGVTGRSFVDLLHLAGIEARVFDERASVSALFADNPDCVTLGAFHADTFTDFGTVLISPGVDARRDCFAAVQDKLLTDIELFARLTDKPVIGVTASNGKSTVVTLINAVCQCAGRDFTLCGNIGLSVLQALISEEQTNEGYIIELSSYHLERAPSLKPKIGVWLNVSPDHLDRYDSFDAYAATKAKIFAQSDTLIVNADDEYVMHFAKAYREKTLFSAMQTADFYAEHGNIFHRDTMLFNMADFPQLGSHHADNVMAVFAVADILGIDATITAKACQHFKPLASRAVVVATHNGVTFINDSKGTNIGATVAAIKGIAAPIVLLAGGQGKDQDFHQLVDVAQHNVKTAVLFGQDAEVIETAMQGKVTTVRKQQLDDAFAQAVSLAESGDVVMLSPACASFDQFESYLKRGERFEQLVTEWIDVNH